jgi:hypothetical protein
MCVCMPVKVTRHTVRATGGQPDARPWVMGGV